MQGDICILRGRARIVKRANYHQVTRKDTTPNGISRSIHTWMQRLSLFVRGGRAAPTYMDATHVTFQGWQCGFNIHVCMWLPVCYAVAPAYM